LQVTKQKYKKVKLEKPPNSLLKFFLSLSLFSLLLSFFSFFVLFYPPQGGTGKKEREREKRKKELRLATKIKGNFYAYRF